jgi:hypothetical protein
MPFVCSICGEESTGLCVRCTKDTCRNHLCDRCLRCSDCCECEVVLDAAGRGLAPGSARAALSATVPAAGPSLPEPNPDPDPDPEPPQPSPGPDPFAEDAPEPGPVTP